MKTNLTFLALALLAVMTPLASAQEETAAQLWDRLEKASRNRVLTKHKTLLEEPNGSFGDLLNSETDQASAANDPIFQSPEWPEKIAERAYAKYSKAANQTPPQTTPQSQWPQERKTYKDAVGSFLIDGTVWRGTIHEYNNGKVSITADVTAHKIAWVPVEKLAPEVRGWLGIGSSADSDAFAQQAEREKQMREAQTAEAIRRAEADEKAARAQMEAINTQIAEAQKAADDILRAQREEEMRQQLLRLEQIERQKSMALDEIARKLPYRR